MANCNNHLREDGLIVKAQLGAFGLAFILGIFVGPVLPELPGEMVFKMVDMLFVCGTILLAIKLAREGWDMAASGFTILGIGWGILFAAIDFQHINLDMEVRTSAAYFFVPCMVLIAFYRPFPVWLKVLTVWCIVPYLIALFVQKLAPENESRIMLWLSGGFLSFHTVSLMWGLFFFRQHRKESQLTNSIDVQAD